MEYGFESADGEAGALGAAPVSQNNSEAVETGCEGRPGQKTRRGALVERVREGPFNMGTITRNGFVDIWGTRSAEKTYTENSAKIIGGFARQTTNGSLGARTTAEKMPRLSDFLPQHEQAWLDAMEQYIPDSLAATPAG